MKIRKLCDEIYRCMPSKYHYPIKICRSENDIYREILKEDKDGTIEDIRAYYTDYFDKRKGIYSKEAEKYRGFEGRGKYVILAVSGNPILLNRYRLSKENIMYVALTVLHEIGHNTGYASENYADKFAVEWLEKIRPNIIHLEI